MTQASRTLIPVEESFGAWRRDLQYVEAYNAIEELAKPEVIDGKTCSFFAWSSPIFQVLLSLRSANRVRPSCLLVIPIRRAGQWRKYWRRSLA